MKDSPGRLQRLRNIFDRLQNSTGISGEGSKSFCSSPVQVTSKCFCNSGTTTCCFAQGPEEDKYDDQGQEGINHLMLIFHTLEVASH